VRRPKVKVRPPTWGGYIFCDMDDLDPFGVNFCVWYEVGGPNSFFYTWVSFLSPHHLLKTLFFPC